MLNLGTCGTGRYLYDNACIAFRMDDESIPVAGADPYALHVQRTQQDTVVLPTNLPLTATSATSLPGSYQHVLALRSTLFDGTLHMSSALGLATMSSWSDFLAATTNLPLGINWVVGTASGQIGYRMSGVLPVQPSAGLVDPLDGSTSNTAWRGYVPQAEMPQLIDPSDVHWLVTANNQVVPLSDTRQVGGYPDEGYRARRITQMLQAIPSGTATTADMERIQTDVVSLPAQTLAPIMQAVGTEVGGTAAKAAAVLAGWDGALTANSSAGALYETTLADLIRDVMQPRLGSQLYASWIQSSPDEGSGVTAVALAIAQDPAAYFPGSPTQTMTARDGAIAHALDNAMASLTAAFGAKPSQWSWGRLHQLNLSEPGLGTLPLLGAAFSISSLPRGGDENTISQGGNYSQYLVQPDDEQTYGPFYRQVIDMGNPAASVWILAPGESGNSFSSHFSDQLSLWNDNHYTTMDTNPSSAGNSLLVLLPQDVSTGHVQREKCGVL